VTETKVLIIGYGNLLRGDDGAGRLVAAHLAETLKEPGIQVQDCHQLVPELAEDIAQAGLVLFVDASEIDPPGQIVCRPVQPAVQPHSGPHDLTPQGLLGWAQQLYGRQPPAFVYSVGGESFKLSDQLSPVVQSALPALEDMIVKHTKM
jgi:hydrogenase maturation protease